LVKGIAWIKALIFGLCLAPLASLAWKGANAELGANPIEVITRSTGLWTLILIMVTLSVTPARKLTGQLWLIRLRRMLGLFAFFYGSLHFLTFVWLDKFFDLNDMLADVRKRPFITAGFTAFVLMAPLAVTSTRKMIQRLGGRRWQWLHRLIYITATVGVIHFYWLVKKDVSRPLRFAVILSLLLGYRLLVWVWPLLAARLERRGQPFMRFGALLPPWR
jgi:sulfoxide reductase heme-binding subunit YedZ